MSGSGISWAVCKSAPCSRQTTALAPHDSVFYRPDALPGAQPTASKLPSLFSSLQWNRYPLVSARRWFHWLHHSRKCTPSVWISLFVPRLLSVRISFVVDVSWQHQQKVKSEHCWRGYCAGIAAGNAASIWTGTTVWELMRHLLSLQCRCTNSLLDTCLLCMQWTRRRQCLVQLAAATRSFRKVLPKSCLLHVFEASPSGRDILLTAWSMCPSSSRVMTTLRRSTLITNTALPSTTQPSPLESMVSNCCSHFPINHFRRRPGLGLWSNLTSGALLVCHSWS